MKVINLVPGSPEWLKSRSASKAPVIMGDSNYQTRNELLFQMFSGITKEIDARTQARFDNGHRTESLSREIVEEMIGEDLSPVSASDDEDYLTANFDGVTFPYRIGYEHKDWNEKLAASVRAGIVPDSHAWQLDQQILVGKLDYVIFVVSDGTKDNFASIEYRTTKERTDKLMAAWKQFDIDLANYQHVEVIPAAVAAPTKDLPALSIQVNGSISLISNLAKFGAELNTFVAAIDKEPSDDQGFADAEAAIKTLQNAQDALEAAEANALAQTSDIDDMRKTVKLYADTARTTRLMLEKMVKLRKDSIRVEITQGGKAKLEEHIYTLNKRLGKPYMPIIAADFAAAVKGKRTITSLREAVNNELLRCQLESSAIADKIEINLNSMRELAADYWFLFSDTQQIVLKNNDDLVALVKVRIADHEKENAAKFEAERAKMQAEATAKAEREVAETLIAEEARIRAEERTKIKEKLQPASTGLPIPTNTNSSDSNSVQSFMQDRYTKVPESLETVSIRPSRIQIIETISQRFHISYSAAEQCIINEFSIIKEMV